LLGKDISAPRKPLSLFHFKTAAQVPNYIYLDNNSTTKPDSLVVQAMVNFLTSNYGNPSSSHLVGRIANTSIENARQKLSDLLKCNPRDLIFTSGATESINLALKGVVHASFKTNPHIITLKTEHPAVLDTCKYLEGIGCAITYLPVEKDGLIDLLTFEKAIRPNTILACIMLVNNETGVIQPIKLLTEIAHKMGVLFMTDATQAIGKLPVDVSDLETDLLCLSGHKFYGPKGIGALYIKSKTKMQITKQMHGGNQEGRLRSGTLNVPGIVGLGEAAAIACQEMQRDKERIGGLRDYLESELLKIKGVFVNGNIKNRLYNVSNLCFEGIDADSIMASLENIMVSNGSACTSALVEPSHVLIAMGLTEEQAFSSIRFSLGRFTTKDEIDITIKHYSELLHKNEYQKA